MKITGVRVEMLFKTKDFENERIGMEAVLEEGENPQVAIAQLKVECFKASQQYSSFLAEAEKVLSQSQAVQRRVSYKVQWAQSVRDGQTSLSYEDWKGLYQIEGA